MHDSLKKTMLYLLPAGRCVIVLRRGLWHFNLYVLLVSSFSELMPIMLNVVIGVPQMLSNIQMILICVGVSGETPFLPGFILACRENVVDTNLTWTLQTYVLFALSMCFEPPETGFLSRPPRNVRKERMASGRLFLQAYGFLGILESFCAMLMSVTSPFSYQMFLNALIMMCICNACSGRFGTYSVLACRFPR